MQRYFIDTNIFLRFFIAADEQHEECKQFFEKAHANPSINCYTSSSIIGEITYTLRSFYGFTRIETVKVLESIISEPIIIIQEEDIPFAIDLYKKHNIKFVDCLTASIKRVREGMLQLLSYDEEFDKLQMIRKTPSDVK